MTHISSVYCGTHTAHLCYMLARVISPIHNTGEMQLPLRKKASEGWSPYGSSTQVSRTGDEEDFHLLRPTSPESLSLSIINSLIPHPKLSARWTTDLQSTSTLPFSDRDHAQRQGMSPDLSAVQGLSSWQVLFLSPVETAKRI